MTAVWSVLLILTGWWPGVIHTDNPAPAILTVAERLQSDPSGILALERSL